MSQNSRLIDHRFISLQLFFYLFAVKLVVVVVVVVLIVSVCCLFFDNVDVGLSNVFDDCRLYNG